MVSAKTILVLMTWFGGAYSSLIDYIPQVKKPNIFAGCEVYFCEEKEGEGLTRVYFVRFSERRKIDFFLFGATDLDYDSIEGKAITRSEYFKRQYEWDSTLFVKQDIEIVSYDTAGLEFETTFIKLIDNDAGKLDTIQFDYRLRFKGKKANAEQYYVRMTHKSNTSEYEDSLLFRRIRLDF